MSMFMRSNTNDRRSTTNDPKRGTQRRQERGKHATRGFEIKRQSEKGGARQASDMCILGDV